jgi:uncharacterized damage-inducible protein DinB
MPEESRGELNSIKEWYRYNSFVRKKYFEAVAKLPPEEITKDRGASFPSLLDILSHTLGAYLHWFFHYYGLPRPQLNEKEDTIQTLKEDEKKIDSVVMGFVEGLKPGDLDNTFEASDETNSFRFTLRQMLPHLIEEELQHRGELNALFWQMDIDPPITDWLDWKIQLGEIKPLPKKAGT